EPLNELALELREDEVQQAEEVLSAAYEEATEIPPSHENESAYLESVYASATAVAPGSEQEASAEQVDNSEPEEISYDLPAVADAQAQETETEAEPTLIATSNAPVIERDNEDIDAEIIEIFIEEANEVTETISEYFPRWAQNFEDNNSLIEFRRAFHTLKGSGRMVGANEIGELAWSIENMLNRVLDNTIAPQAVHVRIIENVCALLPDMIAAFRDNLPYA